MEDGLPAVFDRYSNSFLKIYFEIPEGRENEIARKVLIKHLQSGNCYGIQLKEKHCKFPQPELGSWVEGSRIVGDRLARRRCSRAGSRPRTDFAGQMLYIRRAPPADGRGLRLPGASATARRTLPDAAPALRSGCPAAQPPRARRPARPR